VQFHVTDMFSSKQNDGVAHELDTFPSASEMAPEPSLVGICRNVFNIHYRGQMKIRDQIIDEFKVFDKKDFKIQGFKEYSSRI